ncbi:MAG: glycosyltransferase family 4 protein [Pseudomonadota bacterium]
MSSEELVVNLHAKEPSWSWLSHRTPPDRFYWKSYSERPQSAVERLITRPQLSRYRAVFSGVAAARRENAVLIVTHGPQLAAATRALCRTTGLRIPHLAVAFTMTRLPGPMGRAYMTRAIRGIDRFVCFSSIERARYAEVFDIPTDKIDILRWSVAEPDYDVAAPALIEGDYICAVGGEGRDVPTLFAAMKELSDLKLVLVTRPANIAGLEVPTNVDVRTNIPLEEVWNITHNARLHVLPLVSSDVPAGHGTLIMAMQLSTPSVVTRSEAMIDYVDGEETALECEPQDPSSLGSQVRRLWDDQDLAERITSAGRRFAIEECSEDRTYAYFHTYLKQRGLISDTDAVA